MRAHNFQDNSRIGSSRFGIVAVKLFFDDRVDTTEIFVAGRIDASDLCTPVTSRYS